MNETVIQGPVAAKESGIEFGEGGRVSFGGAFMQATRDSFSIGFSAPRKALPVVSYEPIKADVGPTNWSIPKKLPEG